MKAKKFFASTMQQALKKVSEQMGPDAVVLANRKVNGGVEVITALDYDPKTHGKIDFDNYQSAGGIGDTIQKNGSSLLQAELRAANEKVKRSSWGEEPDELIGLNERLSNTSIEKSKPAKKKSLFGGRAKSSGRSANDDLGAMKQEILGLKQMLRQQLDEREMADYASYHPLHASALKRLTQLGLSNDVSRSIVDRISEMHDEQSIWREALTLLAEELPIAKNDLLDRGGLYVFYGPSGSGKTTSIAKLAAKYALRHGSEGIVLISTDGQRIGAHEQLRTLGRILNVPVRVVDKKHSLEQLLNTVRNKPLVIIDTPGVDPAGSSVHQQLRAIQQNTDAMKSLLTIPSTAQKSVINRVVQSYQDFKLTGCILTKLDEGGLLGDVLDVMIRNLMPVAYISNGVRIPDDIESANAGNLISKAVYMQQQLSGEVSVFAEELKQTEQLFGARKAS